MARADRRRAQRARPAAAARRSEVVIEDTMFFPRLRRHAKWMFLFLALAFGLGFVGFGVGAGGIGIGDVFRDAAGGTGVPSISDSEQRVLENPEGRAGVQGSRDRTPGGRQHRRGGRGAAELHRAAAQEHRRPARARRPLPAAGVRCAGARADLPDSRGVPRAGHHSRHRLPDRRQPARSRSRSRAQ